MIIRLVCSVVVVAVILSGCGGSDPDPGTSAPATSPTSPPPTITMEPAAAMVNGEPILLSAYDAELLRLEVARSGAGTDLALTEEDPVQLLEAMIDRRLLAEGAAAQGFFVADETLDERISSLADQVGGWEVFNDWLTVHQYSLESFRQDLAEELLAARMTEVIWEQIPSEVEQVHGFHILLADAADAEWILGQLASGADFGELAKGYSIDSSTAPAGGDLGWFPRGYLLWPELDDVFFTLEPGEISGVVESQLGYHILQTSERGLYPLWFEAMQTLRESAVKDWLTEQRTSSEIAIYITP